MEYLGNLMTISLGGALLLTPVLIGSLWVSVSGYFALLWFVGVVGLMFLEHLRRTRYLQINAWATLSWVTYRILVLIVIFYFFAI